VSRNLSKAFRKLCSWVNVKKSKGKTVSAEVELVESALSILVVSGPVLEYVHKIFATSLAR